MRRGTLVWAALLLVIACGDDDGGADSGVDSSVDAGAEDAGSDAATEDAAAEDAAADDAATDDAAAEDAATDTGLDASSDASVDAGSDAPTDTGTDATMDAAVEDDGIAEVRAAPEGSHDPPLDVRNVTVTFVRGAVDPDPAGFFVQAERTGPALFVAIDPTTLAPEPMVGDVVDFDVMETAIASDQTRVTVISGFNRDATGADVSALVQDLSAATDVATDVGNYESELVTISGTLEGFARSAGGEFLGMGFETEGVELGVVFRAEASLYVSENLRAGCMVTVTSPLWRFFSSPQAQVYTAADLTVDGACDPVSGANPPADGVLISEIFYDFDSDLLGGSDNDREWFEVWNPSETETYNLRGCEIYDAANTSVIVEDVEIAPDTYVVIGGEESETAPVTLLPLVLNNTDDTVGIRCGGVVVNEVSYDESDGWSAARSVSLQLSRGVLANDAPGSWCLTADEPETEYFAGQNGSPGLENALCPL
ncbi:MAG: hypothetical protein AAGE52_27010 [Myxococcota bacterium]